jgi:hypothetical protein
VGFQIPENSFQDHADHSWRRTASFDTRSKLYRNEIQHDWLHAPVRHGPCGTATCLEKIAFLYRGICIHDSDVYMKPGHPKKAIVTCTPY